MGQRRRTLGAVWAAAFPLGQRMPGSTVQVVRTAVAVTRAGVGPRRRRRRVEPRGALRAGVGDLGLGAFAHAVLYGSVTSAFAILRTLSG